MHIFTQELSLLSLKVIFFNELDVLGRQSMANRPDLIRQLETFVSRIIF